MRQYKYDYYRITLPRDMVIESGENAIRELGENAIRELGNIAINEAKERVRLYVIPCFWESKLVDFDFENVTFKVIRTRHNVQR